MANGRTNTLGFGGGGTLSLGGGGNQPSEAELNKALQALALILQERAAEPSFIDPMALLQRSFPQPPAQSFRPSSGAFGQNNAIFSNVSQVPSKGDRRLANTGSTILNIIRAIQAANKKPGGRRGGGSGGFPSTTSPFLG